MGYHWWGAPEEAQAIAAETLSTARAHTNPFFIALALTGYGRAFAQTDPAVALRVLHEGLVYAEEHRLAYFQKATAASAAILDSAHGDPKQALDLFDAAIDGLHRAGKVGNLAGTLAGLTVFFDRFGQPDVATAIYGASRHLNSAGVMTVPQIR